MSKTYSKPQVTIDLQEYEDLKAASKTISSIEVEMFQHITGLLLYTLQYGVTIEQRNRFLATVKEVVRKKYGIVDLKILYIGSDIGNVNLEDIRLGITTIRDDSSTNKTTTTT